MEIVVCVKQVPESTRVRINPETNTIVREGTKGIVNPFDLYAVEEALRLREKLGGRVRVLTMGPPMAEEALRECVSMGADEAHLVSDRVFAGSDSWATSYILSAALRKMGRYDLILFGKQAIDGDTAQVGPGVAEHLGIPFVAFARKVREAASDHLVVERIFEEGYEVVRLPLPGCLTVVKEINEPRLPSLKGKMKAKSCPIARYGRADLEVEDGFIGLAGSPTHVMRIFAPELRKGGERWTGEPAELAVRLAETLRALKLV
jgi:electron transfer flavoprotein beta subunit